MKKISRLVPLIFAVIGIVLSEDVPQQIPHIKQKIISPKKITKKPSPKKIVKPLLDVSGFQCEAKKTCSQMSSCAEALFYLKECGVKRLDGDKDLIPCEGTKCLHK
ncbi:MAG: excalibur calcium-binding domain-containing protein [Methylococcales bacterium]|nr:excalibur calcium-binding domain-containing protein [Methylococcales bacterium]